MKIPYRDLAIRDPLHLAELMAATEKVMKHGRFILGPEVGEFEEAFATACGRRFAVGVNSGTDALHLALIARGVGSGDEVILPPLSWIASLNAVTLTGATPVFVDIGDDLNLDPELLEAAITPRTRAVVPVHFTGRVCDMERIGAVAARHDIPVIEDAAQAYGGRRSGLPAGAFGELACFSMNPMKTLAACGEAGAIVTDSAELAEKLRSLRYAGTINREDCHTPSLNGRIDTLQAAYLTINLRRTDQIIEQRRQIAAFYRQQLGELVVCPTEQPEEFHSYYSYTILCEERDALQRHLAERGVETKIQHPILLPYHTAYRDQFSPEIPRAEKLVKQILCLPNQENLTRQELDYVVQVVGEFFRK